MANRRMGGMSGGPRGNRSFSQQPFQGGGVNPWQGAMPQNSMNQGLLSQLSSNPQQLALALSSLLQPQQQNPPSLLSLPTPPVFNNQGRDFNRFGNRGRDFRRHEPYNKNRNAGNNRNQNQDNRRRGNQNQKKKSANADQKNKQAEKKEEKEKLVDVSVDEAEEKKRDWKDEKNVSEEKEKKTDSGDEGEKVKNKDGPYADIPKEYLNCFVCNKQMWDGESMNKHVRGRAHRQMLESLEESIHITVNILRENMRLLEEKKVIEMERVQRLSRKFNKFQDQESHCNMCDLKFLGKIVNHRKNEGHQRLKRYLHPVCNLCDKEFPSRMEWIEHRLTPEHLRNLHGKLKNKTGGADGDIIIKDDEQDLAIEPLLEESLQMEVECPILELTDDLTTIQNLMPAYKPDRAVSKQSLHPFSGFRCDLCNRSFEDEELAQKHLKTKRHYHSFIEAVRRKYKELQKEKDTKRAEKEKEKEKKDGDDSQADQEMYDPEEATIEDESSVLGADTSQEDDCEGDPSVINSTMDTSMKMEDEGEAEAEAEAEEEEDNEFVEEEKVPVKAEPPATPVKVEPPATPVKKVEVKKEPPTQVTSTPKQQQKPQPKQQPAKTPVGAVKNGAGPKSKKLEAQQQHHPTLLDSYKIPKRKAATKNIK